MVSQTAECDRRRWTKASPCCAITGETTRTATWSKDAWFSWPSNNDSWCCAIRPTTWSKDRARANSRCCVWCSACWSPTTGRRNLKQQFFECAVRFIRFWLGIDCRMTRHFVNFVTCMLQRQESQKRRQNRFLVHHQEIHHQAHAERMSPPFLTQDSSDFCSDYFRNANWTGIRKQGTWMPMSNEACAIKLVMKVYPH